MSSIRQIVLPQPEGTGIPVISLPDVELTGQFTGYLTDGGTMAILVEIPQTCEFGFRYVSDLVEYVINPYPGRTLGSISFRGNNREAAVRKALTQGRKVYTAESIRELLGCLARRASDEN